MNKKLLLSSCLASLVCSAALCADPLVVFPQGDFSCIVEVTSHNIPKPDPSHPNRKYTPVLKKIVITQVGKVRREISFASDNSSSQVWNLIDKGVSVSQRNAEGSDVFVLRGLLRDQACPKLLHFDAESVTWMTGNTLDKESATGGGPVHYQAKVIVAPPVSDEPPETAIYQAWIDPKTLMPLKFDDGQALYVLTFSKEPPVGPLIIPANMQSELDRWLQETTPHPHL